MIKITKPKHDATIYEGDEFLNSGQDSILELSYNKTYSVPSRILIKVDIDDLPTADSYYLKLYTSNANEILTDYTIVAHPLSQDWNVGIGKFDNTPETTEDVSWLNAKTDEIWSSGSGNMDFTLIDGGGSWLNYTVSQSFSKSDTDIELNITEFVNLWKTDTIDNYGLILKVNDETVDFGSLQFYSYDTHTVFQPIIYSYYNSGSFFKPNELEPIYDYQYGTILNFINLTDFKVNTIPRIRLTGRERFPKKTYSLVSDYLKPKYLPDTCYYSIKDAHSNHTVIDFDDDYTKISCDGVSNYFDLNLNNFDTERFYRIVIKVIWYNDVVEIFDNEYIFKIKR